MSMHAFFRRLRATSTSDDGVAMLMVIGIGLVMSLFIAVISMRAISTLTNSRYDRGREEAIQIADGGAQAMAQAALAGTRSINIVLPTDATTAFATSGCEKAWATWAATATVGSTNVNPVSPCPSAGAKWTGPTTAPLTSTTSDGTYYALYAADPASTPNDVVYSVGAARAGTSSATRVVRLEVTIKTSTAITLHAAVVSRTDLIDTAGGSITGAGGSIQVYGTFSPSGGGTVSGPVYANTCDSGCQSWASSHDCRTVSPCNSSVTAPTDGVPTLKTTDYRAAADFFMCSDGKLHLGPNYTGSLGSAPPLSSVLAPNDPCANSPSINNTLNWSYSGGQWSYSSGSPSTDATYYAYQNDVKVSGGGAFTGSIIAEGGGTGCNLTGGTVTMTQGGNYQIASDISSNYGPVAVVADGPLTVTAGGGMTGIFYTNEYFTMTGGGSNVDAPVISNDQHSPACGTNKDTAGGGWGYNNDLQLKTNGTPSGTSSAWQEL